MRFYRLSFIYFLSFCAVKCKASCRTSKETITYVSSCPRTQMEWKWRAKAKKCWLVKQQCIPPDKFVYHCVVNGYTNATLEVCAKAATVIGHSCVEFNMLGGIIQESPDYKCEKSCPFSYNSTEAYKYQMCFNNIANVEEQKECSRCICPSKEDGVKNASVSRKLIKSDPISREEIWQIVAIILLIAIVAMIVFVVCNHTKTKCRKSLRSGNNQPTSENPDEHSKTGISASEDPYAPFLPKQSLRSGNNQPTSENPDEHSETGILASEDPYAPFLPKQSLRSGNNQPTSENPDEHSETGILASEDPYAPFLPKQSLRSGNNQPTSENPDEHSETGILASEDPYAPFLPKQRKRYIASIEISESYFCWAVQDKDDKKRANVYDKKDYPTWKQPTSICIMDNQEYFGYEALKKFIKLKSCTFFHKMEKITEEENETTLTKIEMYTKILNFIVGRIKRQANFAPGGAAAEEHTIEYVIATPTHWKGTQLLNDFEEALQKTKEIEHAKSKVIVTKAEMVSPFLHELKADVLCQNFNVDHLSFEENTKYAILDIGTTACELTILTSKKDAKDQAGEPIRTPWSKTVENLFLEMLDSMFGATVMNKFKTDKAGVLELLLSFEKIKTSKDIFKLNAKPEPLPMPCALLDQLSNELINTYLKAGNTIREKNSHISEEEKKDYFLCISPEQVQELFEPMLKIIEETIYKHFSNDQNSDIKCVCIIGGYANTKLVHKKARKCFPERTVVIPKEADIVVVQGAVYYGYKYINDKK